jgi:hypothetical protein
VERLRELCTELGRAKAEREVELGEALTKASRGWRWGCFLNLFVADTLQKDQLPGASLPSFVLCQVRSTVEPALLGLAAWKLQNVWCFYNGCRVGCADLA